MRSTILVMGLGPSGLVAALEAAKAGHPVIAVDKRMDYVRGQILNSFNISSESIAFRHGIILPMTMQIKELERQLIKRVRENPHIRCYTPYEVIAIDPEAGTATLSKVTTTGEETEKKEEADTLTISFTYLFCCDGARRQSLKLLGKDLSQTHEAAPYQSKHPHYGIITAKSETDEELYSTSLSTSKAGRKALFKTLTHLKDPDHSQKMLVAWTRPYLPHAYTTAYGSHRDKVILHCALPDLILKEPDDNRKKRLLWAWAQKLLATMYPETTFREMPPSRKHGVAKDQLHITIAPVQLDTAKEVSFSYTRRGVEQQTTAVLIGDAAMTHWFVNANGAQDGMAMAKAAVEQLQPNGGFNHPAYQEAYRNLTESQDRSTRNKTLEYESRDYEQTCYYIDHILRRGSLVAQSKCDHAQLIMKTIHEIDQTLSTSRDLSAVANRMLSELKNGLKAVLYDIRPDQIYLKTYLTLLRNFKFQLDHPTLSTAESEIIKTYYQCLVRHYRSCLPQKSSSLHIENVGVPEEKMPSIDAETQTSGHASIRTTTSGSGLFQPNLSPSSLPQPSLAAETTQASPKPEKEHIPPFNKKGCCNML